MSKLQNFKRIIIEDFDEKDRDMIGKLAFAINGFADDIVQSFNKEITIHDNLSIVQKTITVTVNSLGVPLIDTNVITGLRVQCAGIQVINAFNITNPSNFPTSCPFIQFSNAAGAIKINKITGLQANQKYSLTAIFYPVEQ